MTFSESKDEPELRPRRRRSRLSTGSDHDLRTWLWDGGTCGNVNAAEGQKEPWRGVDGLEERASWRDREWIGRNGRTSGDEIIFWFTLGSKDGGRPVCRLWSSKGPGLDVSEGCGIRFSEGLGLGQSWRTLWRLLTAEECSRRKDGTWNCENWRTVCESGQIDLCVCFFHRFAWDSRILQKCTLMHELLTVVWYMWTGWMVTSVTLVVALVGQCKIVATNSVMMKRVEKIKICDLMNSESVLRG